MRRTVRCLSFFLLLVPLVGGELFAEHVTKGDVLAIFESPATLKLVRDVSGFSAAENSAPVDGFLSGFIGAFPDVRTYCVDDWHVIRVGLLCDFGRPATYMEQVDCLNAAGVEFQVDGVPISTTRTPVKVSVRLLPDRVYFFNEGKLYAPGELGVGRHTLRLTVTHPNCPPAGVCFLLNSEFIIEPHDASFCPN